MLDLELSAGACFFGQLLERVDVVKIDFFDFSHGGVDVAGHGDVDEEQWAVLAGAAGLFDILTVDDGVGRTGRGDHDVDAVEDALPVVEAHGGAVHLRREFFGAVEGTVCHEDRFGSSGDEALRGRPAHFTGAQDHDFAVLEVAEDFFGQIDGHVADGGRSFLDRGFGADFFADAKGALEDAIEHGSGRPGFQRGLVGLFDLAEDFRFADHHGIQPADDATEVLGGGGFFFAVKVGGHARVDLDLLGQSFFDAAKGGLCIGGGEVKFRAVAGRDDHAFRSFGQHHQLTGGFAQQRRAYGESLPHFHGGRAVIEAEANEFHQINAKTASESKNRMTADSESRRPVTPRTCLIPNNSA